MPWEPFSGGPWQRSELWRYNLAVVDAASDARITAADRTLRDLFSADWVTQQLAGGPWHRHEHPFFRSFGACPGGMRLLELGHALATLSVDRATHKRLRQANEFSSVEMELLVGLVLHRAGARVRQPPVAATKRPDWIAHWPDGAELAVEVKVPRRNARDERRKDVAGHIQRAGYELDLIPPGLAVHLMPSPDIVDALARQPVSEFAPWPAAQQFAEDFVRAALTAIDGHGSGETRVGDYGTVRVGPAEDFFRITVEGYFGHPGRRESRVAGFVFDAARQIRPTGLPGIVVLDATWHFPPVDWEAGISLALQAEECDNIAAVLVHSCFTQELWPFHTFHPIPGRAARAVGDRFDGVFTQCALGHWHFEPLRAAGPHHCLL